MSDADYGKLVEAAEAYADSVDQFEKWNFLVSAFVDGAHWQGKSRVWNDDMDAAPKNGSRFLAWDAEGGCVCLVNWPLDPEPDETPEWEVYELDTLDWISFGWHLTKWAPLPQPDWVAS